MNKKKKVMEVMQRKFEFSSTVLQSGIRLFLLAGFILAGSLALQAQETRVIFGTVNREAGGQGHGSFFINGSDIGTILLKASDLDQDGKATLVELKAVALACYKLWDSNTNGTLSGGEFSAGLKELFPVPPGGGKRHAVRVINGVAVEVSGDQLPTPDAQVAKRILAGADTNKDGDLSAQEIDDFLGKSFSQWDQDGNGSLDAEELNTAFAGLAMPD